MLLQTRHFAAPSPWKSKPSTKTKTKATNIQYPKCSRTHLELELRSDKTKPLAAEVARTIMEVGAVGTLSTLTEEGWPLGTGVRFAVDPEGTPLLKLNGAGAGAGAGASSLHVQLNQCGLRTPQCTVQGRLTKAHPHAMKVWRNRFGEQVDPHFLYIVAVDRVLHLEDFHEDGVWVTSSDYKNAQPDPLRHFAHEFVTDINSNNIEDLTRFCNVYVDLDFQVSEAKLIWVDRLGFDMRLSSPHKGVFEVRIPFPREVTDEKGAKSTFNCMSQLAWEVERNFHLPHFHKVKQFKHIKS